MEKITLVNKNGEEVEYKAILASEDPDTKKGYLVYTEDRDDGDLYLASYDPLDEDNLQLTNVETDDEKDMIMDLLEELL